MNGSTPPIRMVFEMTREEHPRLYDDLVRFPKGTKRINRLRTLAHDGLLFQSGVLGHSPADLHEAGQRMEGSGAGRLTSQIFEEPLAD
ncbi:hypothetical protein [Xanthomonas hortorum]|uniref:Uncharacterized protein n=1 Tax=Xanthomonas hortorum pv. hederae TaxID=453603 RepID=A0A9X4H2P2_9XANT|nr:hypothetical protein [Xanthomonas hortorum]MCE4369740.1 hypothetical protein [Xanthomonas hortorum pv. hederae]MDC8638755.1 hypothetical protein [Xanthomonas hortorum pv. hederae]PPU86273.1 hypothetical protein XhhCFBP4925_00670 [Xanthomonas hortorum pv. hederae]PUF01400.1 hypothetical protein C7T87_03540 [Xanthomonas hortorum pv. hederae]